MANSSLSFGIGDDVRRLPGMMLKDEGKAVREAERAVGSRPGKYAKLTAGAYIAYSLTTSTKARKVCAVGRNLSVSARESTVVGNSIFGLDAVICRFSLATHIIIYVSHI